MDVEFRGRCAAAIGAFDAARNDFCANVTSPPDVGVIFVATPRILYHPR